MDSNFINSTPNSFEVKSEVDQQKLFKEKEDQLREKIGTDTSVRKPFICYIYNEDFLSVEMYEAVVNKLNRYGDHISWCEKHPFLFALCLIRKFLEESDGTKYNLFYKDLKINKFLDSSLNGILHEFGPNDDRRYNIHKVLSESLFFFGAKSSRSYGVLSRIRQELRNFDNVEDGCREILDNEVSIPFAYYYLLLKEDATFCNLLLERHESKELQEYISSSLSDKLHDTFARIGWAIDWSSKSLDVFIERFILADQRIMQLKVNKTFEISLDKLRYTKDHNTRQFSTIALSQIGCEIVVDQKISISCGIKEELPLLKFDKPVVFHKIGDFARQWIPDSKKSDEVLRASEILLLYDADVKPEIKLGKTLLECFCHIIKLNRKRFYAYHIDTSQLYGKEACPLFVNDEQLFRVGVRPRFIIKNGIINIYSNDGFLISNMEIITIQLSTQENIKNNELEVFGCDNYKVNESTLTLSRVEIGRVIRIVYRNRIRTKILRINDNVLPIIDDPTRRLVGVWQPDEQYWSYPGKTFGNLTVCGISYRVWVKWSVVKFAWRNIAVNEKWKINEKHDFREGFLDLNQWILAVWLPKNGILKLGNLELCQFEAGLNQIE